MYKNAAKYLVVVSVVKGRKFPKRNKHSLIVEARFDGELLSTDPVPHIEQPEFTQELAWELDRKALLQHRLQRTNIKIQCYASDGTVKEQIGYVILDLRSAQPKQVNKWYPLLHTKYPRSKPEVCISLYLDEDKDGAISQTQTNKDIIKPSQSVNQLQPYLDEAQGLYQIGSADTCTDIFVLSITITFAANLGQLIPSSVQLQSTSYFFYYSLFGNDVTNEVFSDLFNPNFPVERSSVKIRSNVDTLQKFFANQSGLQVHLCCGDQSLGSCEIPLSNLLKAGSTKIFMQPLTLEGTYKIIAPHKVKPQSSPLNPSTSPMVGITLVLKKDSESLIQQPLEDVTQDLDGSYLSTLPQKQADVKKSIAFEEKTNSDVMIEKHDVVSNIKDDNVIDQQGQTQESRLESQNIVEERISQNTDIKSSTLAASTTCLGVTNISDQSPIRFTFSIDLRSVSNISIPTPQNIYLRYLYPFFGNTTPISTYPPTPVEPGQEALLPESFCVFNFACTHHLLRETFTRVPLLVELWHKDVTLNQDQLLGTASVTLALVLSSQKTRFVVDERSGNRQVYSDKVPIRSISGESRCADLIFVLSLEDWGHLDPALLSVSSSLPKQQNATQPQTELDVDSPEKSNIHDTRETTEYKAAIEIEMWKETQQKLFDVQLKQKEERYMKALADEWKKRDGEREIILKKKMAEYGQLEAQLHKTVADLEKRDKQLILKEQEVSRLKTDLHREHEHKLQSLREASKRLKEDCDHQVNLEKSKISELEASIEKLKREVSGKQKQYNDLEMEFTLYKEKQTHTPEVRLQSQINLLTTEKVELERKLEATAKSKVHYKQQWSRALKEVAHLKQREQEVAMASVKKQQEELEQLKLKYLAAEEKDIIVTERKEFEEIKNELNRLCVLEQQNQSEKLQHPVTKPTSTTGGGDASFPPQESESTMKLNEKIARLTSERDSLLRTGVYTSQDGIIARLEKQIGECLSLKHG